MIDEWKQIISALSRKEHVVFFDSAYQGFASGDAEADAQPFRYSVAQGIPILLAQSFAKNFGKSLYMPDLHVPRRYNIPET